MSEIRIGAVAARFGRDLDFDLQRIATLIEHARQSRVSLLVLPDAALGGYLADLRRPDPAALPPALTLDDPHIRKVAALAAELVVCLGLREADGDHRYNTALCVHGDGILGHHRKVHQPAGESIAYSAGADFSAFDTPVGRIGMLIDYDKTFPESARTLALDGAEIQARLFDLYDQARAAENQVVLASANQTGVLGALHFLGQAKVVGPGGEILTRTWSKAGIAVAELDVTAEIAKARRVLRHLAERRPAAYRLVSGD